MEGQEFRKLVHEYLYHASEVESLKAKIEQHQKQAGALVEQIAAQYPRVLYKLSEVPGIPPRVLKAMAKANVTNISDLINISRWNGYLKKVSGVSEKNMQIVSTAIRDFVGAPFSIWGR